jgi:hypothetical protein
MVPRRQGYVLRCPRTAGPRGAAASFRAQPAVELDDGDPPGSDGRLRQAQRPDSADAADGGPQTKPRRPRPADCTLCLLKVIVRSLVYASFRNTEPGLAPPSARIRAKRS